MLRLRVRSHRPAARLLRRKVSRPRNWSQSQRASRPPSPSDSSNVKSKGSRGDAQRGVMRRDRRQYPMCSRQIRAAARWIASRVASGVGSGSLARFSTGGRSSTRSIASSQSLIARRRVAASSTVNAPCSRGRSIVRALSTAMSSLDTTHRTTADRRALPVPATRGEEGRTYQCRRSPPAPVIEQHGQTVGRRCRRRREFEVAKPTRRPPNLDPLGRIRNDSGDRRVAIEHGQRTPVPDRSEMFTQPSFQIGNAHGLHDYIRVISGQEVGASLAGARSRVKGQERARRFARARIKGSFARLRCARLAVSRDPGLAYQMVPVQGRTNCNGVDWACVAESATVTPLLRRKPRKAAESARAPGVQGRGHGKALRHPSAHVVVCR